MIDWLIKSYIDSSPPCPQGANAGRSTIHKISKIRNPPFSWLYLYNDCDVDEVPSPISKAPNGITKEKAFLPDDNGSHVWDCIFKY